MFGFHRSIICTFFNELVIVVMLPDQERRLPKIIHVSVFLSSSLCLNTGNDTSLRDATMLNPCRYKLMVRLCSTRGRLFL